jgi:hypothetical protein
VKGKIEGKGQGPLAETENSKQKTGEKMQGGHCPPISYQELVCCSD